MYKIVATIIIIIGFVLIFSVDTILSENTTNPTLLSIYKNNKIAGAACVFLGYYIYELPVEINSSSLISIGKIVLFLVR